MTLRLLHAATVAALVATTASAGEVYRCVSGTHVEYRDQPCEGVTQAVLVPAAAPPAHGTLILAQSPAPDSASADPGPPVAPGMSPRAVYQSLGRPLDMNVRIEGITPVERWWYRTPDGMLTVTFRHGRVASAVTR